MIFRRSNNKPRDIRQQLSHHEPGAHLYTPFFVHWKGGVASLIPFGIIFFTTQPFSDAMTLLTMGGYTIGPAVIAIAATLWAFMSMGILHVLRFRDQMSLHLAVYAIVGAVVLTVIGLLMTAAAPVVAAALLPDAEVVQQPGAMLQTLTFAPLLGAAGSLVGRWAIDKGITWYRWIVRNPLPDVFGFVDGKRDKDEFKRM